MCDICLKSPCDPRCPNAKESAVKCAWCETPINAGEEYYDINQDKICVECINDCRRTMEE